jgi:RND family efflux transporter MFP subunit
MRKFLIVGLLVAGGAAAAYFLVLKRGEPAAAADQAQAQNGQGGQGQRRGQPAPGGGGPGGGGFGGGGFGGPGGGFRPPMTVEVAKVSRGNISAYLSVVGNLIGEQTVDVAPKTGGRLVSVSVKLGDRVRRGQTIAKIEDREMLEQVRQAEASQKVAEATIRQREADLKVAETSVERSRNLFGRQLLPRQTLDDAEARFSAAQAQVDLAVAQLAQNAARLEELKINLSNTVVSSPVDGFVGARNVDAGAWVSQNAPVVSVVDISSLRLVANVVEKDLRMVTVGDKATVEVDAFPGEKFSGRIARVSPVLDPATRTAVMEVEIPNASFKLKPGMYAKVNLEVEGRENVLLVPKVALVDSEGQRGVFQSNDQSRAQFKAVKVGLEDAERVEVVEGLSEGETVISVGAGALRRNDQLLIAGQGGSGQRGPGQNGERGGARQRPNGQGGQGAANGTAAPQGPGREGQPGAVNPSQANPGQGAGGRPARQPGQRPPQSQRQLQQRPVA